MSASSCAVACGEGRTAGEVAAALGELLVFQMQAADSGADELGDGAGGGFGTAETGVGVAEGGDADGAGDVPGELGDLGEGEQADVGEAGGGVTEPGAGD